ncbi:hypothetical protein HD842_003959 [Massilia aurea]|uniref:Uncharacterized protein n=1 Tax=Massilia aurea TaxID=373040 RepID=A0A7X0CG74_9BURK|nr:hypothetical protein [Massilia aurea]MBB6135792.1 hypothetical protein [Massilia aurea]
MMNAWRETLLLNLDRTGSATRLPFDENWQHEAFRFVKNELNAAIAQAEVYAHSWSNSHTTGQDHNQIERSYNAIFINGSRGAGKTAFMINIEMMWRAKFKESKLCFLPLIDPTLIRDEEGFDSYLVAQVHYAVRSYHAARQQSRPSEIYLRALESLGESLAPTDGKTMGIGIDRILSYQVAQTWEWRFHNFLYQATLELNVTAFVFRIDDIDMSLGRAHGLLETLRRWLACPFSVPLVSGDINLYRQLAQQYFNEHSKHGIDSSYQEKLAENYLEKLFPTNLRTQFTSLSLLQPRLEIVQQNFSMGEGIPLDIYLGWMAELVYPFTNGEEGSKPSLLPDTARTLVQLVKMPARYLAQEPDAWRALANVRTSPTEIHYYEIAHCAKDFVETDDGMFHAALRDGWMKYCEAHRNWVGWRVTESEVMLAGFVINSQENDMRPLRRPLRELPIFNVGSQFSIPAEDEHYDFSAECMRQLHLLERGRASAYIESQKSLLAKELRTNIPYPALEYFVYMQFVSQATVEQTLTNIKAQSQGQNNSFRKAVLLLNLYTTHEFYGRSGTATRQLFFGKAFELLLDSILQDYISTNTRQVASHVRRILTTAPFHSTYSVFPTKSVDNDDSTQGSMAPISQDDAAPTDANPRAGLDLATNELHGVQNWLRSDIKRWQIEHAEILGRIRKRGALHLLYCVFNKTFNQLNALKAGSGLISEASAANTLSHAARRFQMIVINAVASFVKPNHLLVVQRNVASGAHIDLNPEKWDSDRSWHINVRSLEKNRLRDEAMQLVKALQAHPIFQLVEIDGDGLFPLGPRKKNATETNGVSEHAREQPDNSISPNLENPVASYLRDSLLTTRTRRPGIVRLMKALLAIPRWEVHALQIAHSHRAELELLRYKADKYEVPGSSTLGKIIARAFAQN